MMEDDARAALRADTEARLAKLLDNHRTADDGNWPRLTRDQVSEFYDIVLKLADLAFTPDYAGDNVLKIVVVDKRHGQLHWAFEPREPRGFLDGTTDAKEMFQYLTDHNRALALLAGSAQRMAETSSNYARLMFSRTEAVENEATGYRVISDMIEHKLLDEAALSIRNIIAKHNPPRERRAEDSGYRNIPDALFKVLDEYGRALPPENIQPRLDEINKALDAFEAKVQGDNRQERFEARKLLYQHEQEVGKTVLRPVMVRYNGIARISEALDYYRKNGQMHKQDH